MYAKKILAYWWQFVTSPSFQEEQPWMKPVMKFAGLLPPNVWTSMRFPGAIATCWLLFNSYHVSTLIVFLLSVLTDWFDGKSARARGQITANGGILDGTADKVLIILAGGSLVWMFYTQVDPPWKQIIAVLFAVMAISEISRVFMPLSSRFDKKAHCHATMYGKYKFGIQVILVIFLWFAVIFPSWPWWPIWICLLLTVSIVLSIFSIVFRLYPEIEKYAADVVTFGNLSYGSAAIAFALFRDFKTAIVLILIAGGLDLVDGLLARKTKPPREENGLTFGGIFDDIADFVSFAVAPFVILLMFGERAVATVYLAATIGRLFFFSYEQKKGKSVSGVFRGFPSPAAALLLGSFLLWEHPVGSWALPIIGLTMSALEISFFARWYHFRVISRILDKKVAIAGGVVALTFFLLGSGEALSLLLLLYLIFFFKPVADRCWKWD